MKSILSLLLLLCSSLLFSQHSVTGTIVDPADGAPLAGAAVRLISVTDSTKFSGTVSDLEGKFQLLNIGNGEYRLRITYIGHTEVLRVVTVANGNVNTGEISLPKNATNLKEVEVVEMQTRAVQKDDTTEYNASAFKSNPDATAEDLVTKMPGITNEGGTIKAQGENVQKVLIDGKEYFGDDASVALKNVPADIVDRVQVFDRMNDQSSFTGFDDGNSQKAMNIVTKNGMNNGVFGKVYAGYGYLTDSRYSTGASINWFDNDRRISVIGMSNNVNQQNFSMEDLLGATGSAPRTPRAGGMIRGGRSGGGSWMRNSTVGNFMVGQQGGISTTHAAGLNYTDVFGKNSNFKITGSYFFNITDNVNRSDISRQYFNQGDSSTYYRETNRVESRNMNHRINLRMEYTIDSMNKLIFTPKISYQKNSQQNYINGETSISAGEVLSSTGSDYFSDGNGYNISGDLLYQHKFRKLYRTLSLNIGTSVNDRIANTSQSAINSFLSVGDTTVLEQEGNSGSNSTKLTANVTYTEPAGKNAMVQFSYEPGYTWNKSDKRTFNFDTIDNTYTLPDTTLSSSYNNDYMTHKGSALYRLKGERFNFFAGIGFQYAWLNGESTFPLIFSINRHFYNVMPTARLDYRFKDNSNIRVYYRTSTDPPSVSDLQNVIDNTNPLLLSTGNPDLKQSFRHFAMVRYGITNVKKGHSLFLFTSFNYTQNYIANSTRIANEDTLLNNDVILRAGSQFSQPINIDGNMSANLFMTYGLPVTKLKSNINFNAGVNFTRNPSLINGLVNHSNTYRINGGLTLSSNISEKIDFTINYFANYNVVKNSLQTNSNNNFYSHTASARFNWMFWKGFVFATDVQNTLYAGIEDGFNQNVFLWNAGLGYKFFKDRSLEVRVSVFDLLNQNTGISRDISETYIEDSKTVVLKRYMLLTITYTLRFNKKPNGESR